MNTNTAFLSETDHYDDIVLYAIENNKNKLSIRTINNKNKLSIRTINNKNKLSIRTIKEIRGGLCYLK